jgi:hypothetical protein
LAPVTIVNQFTVSAQLYKVLKTYVPHLKSTFYPGQLDVL